MIIDRLSHRELYRSLGHGIPEALDFLAHTDFATLPDGKRAIDGDRLFAVVQRYQAKPVCEARWEIHHHYLDVQYIARGSERIGYAPWTEGLPVQEAYDEQRDIAFYAASGVLLPVSAGMFVVLMPHELHAPCLAATDPVADADVLKVVVKCRWEG